MGDAASWLSSLTCRLLGVGLSPQTNQVLHSHASSHPQLTSQNVACWSSFLHHRGHISILWVSFGSAEEFLTNWSNKSFPARHQMWKPFFLQCLSSLGDRYEQVLSLRMLIRITIMPPTVWSCIWTWGMRCVCSWTEERSTEETRTSTAPSLDSSSTLTERKKIRCLYANYCSFSDVQSAHNTPACKQQYKLHPDINRVQKYQPLCASPNLIICTL